MLPPSENRRFLSYPRLEGSHIGMLPQIQDGKACIHHSTTPSPGLVRSSWPKRERAVWKYVSGPQEVLQIQGQAQPLPMQGVFWTLNGTNQVYQMPCSCCGTFPETKDICIPISGWLADPRCVLGWYWINSTTGFILPPSAIWDSWKTAQFSQTLSVDRIYSQQILIHSVLCNWTMDNHLPQLIHV